MIRARAAECGAPLQFVTESYGETPIALAGSHQKQNAALAIAAFRAAKIDIDNSAIAHGLAESNGQRVFNDGTNAQSSMARIIPLPRVRSQKHGAKFSAISAPRSCWRFFLTKTCAESVKPSHRSASSFCSRKFEANAQLLRKS